MGNPFLLATDLQPTVSYGIVSGTHRYQPPSGTLLEYADCIQADAAVNPGNSGGPLFDAQGRLAGINGRCSFEKRGRVNVGVAYAISINQIKNFLGVLRSGRVVDHATLGATVDWDADGHVVVGEILESSDAYRRGLRTDDEIISFGGRAVSSPNGFKNILGIFPKGWRVPLSFRRASQQHDVLVRLTGLHGEEELLQELGVRPPAPPMPLPKPEEKPKEKPKGKNAKPQAVPKNAKPQAAKPPAAQPVIPEIVTKHIQDKRGYANYYFNKLGQQRVWDAWNAGARLSGAGGMWTLSGPLESGGRFRFELTDAGASLKLPKAEVNWTAGDELGKSLLPPHSGGLMPALYLWRRLATAGLGRFGDVSYYGTAPLYVPSAAKPPLADVLVGSHKGVECRFYFDPADGRLLGLEMSADEESDPCEVYFSGYRRSAGRLVPGRMEVRCGDETFAVLKIDGFQAEKPGGTAK
jgi:hypothetical protein